MVQGQKGLAQARPIFLRVARFESDFTRDERSSMETEQRELLSGWRLQPLSWRRR